MNGGNFKAAVMFFMWVVYLGFLAIIQGSVMDGWFFAVAIVTMLPMIVGMNLLWHMYRDDRNGSAAQEAEKRKRDRIDSVLRDLSDEDLVRLRQRLTNGEIDDDVLYHEIVGTDGEFLRQRS